MELYLFHYHVTIHTNTRTHRLTLFFIKLLHDYNLHACVAAAMGQWPSG